MGLQGFVWKQGAPHLALALRGRPLHPITVSIDLAAPWVQADADGDGATGARRDPGMGFPGQLL